MGIYYKVVCDNPRECIEPFHINNGPNKWPSLSRLGNTFPTILVFAMGSRWFGGNVRMVSDSGDAADYDDESYVDVTEHVIMDYNASVSGADAKYTPLP